MSALRALWTLCTALALCLPGAVRLELCLCDGPLGLFDGRACGTGSAGEPACCCAPGDGAGTRLAPRDVGDACECVTLEAEREEHLAHVSVAPATPLHPPARARATFAPIPGPAARATPAPREQLRTRTLDGVPLRI